MRADDGFFQTVKMILAGAVLTAALVGCELISGNPLAPKPTSTPNIGRKVFGVECQPAVLQLEHGQTGEIKLVDVVGNGQVTEFKLVSVSPASQAFSQSPAANETGWSTLPGSILVAASPVDGPERTEEFFLNIFLGGGSGSENITGGNLWCKVVVKHILPTPTPTATATETPTLTPEFAAQVTTNSPVRLGTNLIISGSHFQPGTGTKWIYNPLGTMVYGPLTFTIYNDGMLSATFFINGPTGTWHIIIEFAGTRMDIPFQVVN